MTLQLFARSAALPSRPGCNFHLRLSALSMAILISLILAGAAQAQTFLQLLSFNGTSGGANPFAGVIMDAQGNLYGTTVDGGSYGSGTVYMLDPSGNETVLHSFAGGNDGVWPYGGLIMDASGNLYGSTHSGGAFGDGTLYKIDPSGNETVLFSFSGPDGSVPLGPLTMDQAGNLYGTTTGGGPNNDGTVFKLDTSGNETVLHNFEGSDGEEPYSGVIMDAAGNFYGTTAAGGSSSNCQGGGCGTVFKLDASGVLHSFSFNHSDGWGPYGGLVRDKAGNLYGTTGLGGTSDYCSNGCGTVFKVDPSGNETVLYNFTGGGADGLIPLAGLVRDAAGNLYGTTGGGGTGGGGTIFKLDPSGNETILYDFPGSDLAYSYGSLLLNKARLYGTSYWGGTSNCFNGCGTVFELEK
jgi:uncharacterized repeat protein (TIGR03803 family)